MVYYALSTVYDPTDYIGTFETDDFDNVTGFVPANSSIDSDTFKEGVDAHWNVNTYAESYFPRGLLTQVDAPVHIPVQQDSGNDTDTGDLLGLDN